MEVRRGFDQKMGNKEVVVPILGLQEASTTRGNHNLVDSTGYTLLDSGSPSNVVGLKELEHLKTTNPNHSFASSTKVSDNEHVIRRRPVARSAYLKPKSRLVEPCYLTNLPLGEIGNWDTSEKPSHRNCPNTPPTGNLRTPLMASPGGGGGGEETDEDEEDDHDKDVYNTAEFSLSESPRKKVKTMVLFEWITFICIAGVLVTSLTVPKLQYRTVWSLEIWKWSVFVMVIFCGRLFTGWFINVIVFLVERNYLLKKKVLYFVYGLKNSVRVFIWLSLVLLAWGLLINRGVTRSRETTTILNGITRGIVSTLIGSGMWVAKTLIVKLLATNYHVKTFFDRIQESIFHQYVLHTLSGPPLSKSDENAVGGGGGGGRSGGRLSFKKLMRGKRVQKHEMIDVHKLHGMKHKKISGWTMRGLIQVVQGSGLSTLTSALDESVGEGENEQFDKEITSEWEAKAAALRIFAKVAKPGSKYIEEEDLLRFMKQEEVDSVLPMFHGAVETRKIKKSTLRKWVVKVYNERKSLAYSLNDTKTAIEELNKILSGIALVLIVIVLSIVMGFASIQVLVFISSQLLVATFVFGNTCKTVFEAIIFIFVMHPFDVGDRCVIDGVQMVVEEMNILTTVFLRYDNEMIIYPNSVLATKTISNFYRSPEMNDLIDFAVDVSTPTDKIVALRARIKEYLESKPQHWRPDHSVQVKEIEDVNKMKMGLTVTHTINFQNYGKKSKRRSELVYELKKIFEDLGIKYSLLPQQVHLLNPESAAPTSPSASRC